MNEEILKKIKELNTLVEAERQDHNRTMIDFFRPTANTLLRVVEAKLVRELQLDNVLSPHLIEKISKLILTIDAEHLLTYSCENSGGDSDTITEVKRLIKNRELLAAVKYYKQKSNLGLKESKDYVDWIKEQMFKENTL